MGEWAVAGLKAGQLPTRRDQIEKRELHQKGYICLSALIFHGFGDLLEHPPFLPVAALATLEKVLKTYEYLTSRVRNRLT